MPNVIPLANHQQPVTSQIWFPGDNVETVNTIRWSKERGILSIEMVNGEKLYATPAPRADSYLLLLMLPLLGYLIPWGAVRAAGWVLAGFVQP